MNAIIFGPGEDSCSEGAERALERVRAHVKRRGYDVVGYVCSISMVLAALGEGVAQVVLFAHADKPAGRPVDMTVSIRTTTGGAVEECRAASRVASMPGFSHALIGGATVRVVERPATPLWEGVDALTQMLTAAYREGYATGFVDCVAMVGQGSN